MSTLADAHAPYRDELAGCCCDLCVAVSVAATARRRLAGDRPTERAYWSAVSDRLRALAEGDHRHETHDDRVTLLPAAKRQVHESISRGLGVGVGPALDVWSRPGVAS